MGGMTRYTICLTALLFTQIGQGQDLRQQDTARSSQADLLDRFEAPKNAQLAADSRIREGSEINLTGSFRITGDRVTFYSKDRELRLRCLENLMLERIARIADRSPDMLEWKMRGTVTEFRGNNFLLVTHAVLMSKAPESTGPSLAAKR
jgi:hypothetical protein